jgi:serine/threonine-protein kinase RsbW
MFDGQCGGFSRPWVKGNIIISKSLPATLDSLSGLREFAKESATEAGIDDARTYKLLLAVDEMATNIVLHGYKEPRPTESITIGSEVSNGELTLTLEDSAPAFDPRTRVMPDANDLSQPLDDRAIGGLGIYLAISSVDRYDYRYEDGRNLNLFTVKVSPK